MVDHIVLFKINESATGEQIEAMLESLRGLQDQFDGITELRCGPNTSDRSQGFTHGLFVRFKSQEDLDEYMPHPIHQKAVADFIIPILDTIIVVDYEV